MHDSFDPLKSSSECFYVFIQAPGPAQPTPATANFEISLANYTVASFTSSEQTAFKTQIIYFLGVAPSTVTVDLQNIRAGSIIFNTVVTFLSGDATRAASLLAVIQQASQLCTPRARIVQHLAGRLQPNPKACIRKNTQ